MRRIAVAIWLLASSTLSGAEPLTEVPAHWADRVVPLPEQRLADLEAASAARILETRGHLNEMLGASDAGAAELAAAFGRLGALYGAHRMYAGAELALRNARALDPQAFQWVYYAAHFALEQGEPEQALDFLADAARIDPSYPTLPLRRGEALLGLNRLTEARAAYRQVVDVADLRAAALYGLAQIDLLERDWAGTTTKLTEVMALQPQADAVHYPLGQALVQLGRRDEARAHLAQRGVTKPTYADHLVEEMRSLQRGARSYYEQALTAVKRGDYAAAAAAFEVGLAEEPDNVRARTSYARALWISGQRDDAEAELRRAAGDGPRETLPRFLLAVLRDAADDPASAIAGYREVLALDAEHEGALSYLANLTLRQGDPVQAVALFERAIASGVIQMPLYLHYWSALLHAGSSDAVLRDKLIAFDRRFPEPPLFRFLLARLLAGSTEPDVADAARALEIARQLQDAQPSPPHSELLALGLAASGDFVQAQALQEQLVEMARMTGALDHAALLEQTAASYRAGHLPESRWNLQDPMFAPPPVDPDLVMRNYPAGQPY